MLQLHSTRSRTRTIFFILVAIATIGLVFPLKARADYISGVSATIDEPSPNPTPAGSTASTTAQFLSSNPPGALIVQVELIAAPGFGTMRLDTSSSELTNCLGDGTTSITCEWDGDSSSSPQSVTVFIDVDGSVAPNTGATLNAIVESATEGPETYASAFMYTAPPIGSTSLSGTVLTEGGVPVDQACIFVLAPSFAVFPGITDASGNWTVSGLPDTYSFAVGVIPPFVGTYGPCAENGPPPVPGPGELQPVFVGDIWIDLSDPLLTGGLGEPFDFAVNVGATVFTGSTSGLQSCLTTAPANQIPRPPCIAATTTTVTTGGSTTSTPIDVGGADVTTSTEASPDTLPLTGVDSPWALSAGAVLFLVGILVVARGSRLAQRND